MTLRKVVIGVTLLLASFTMYFAWVGSSTGQTAQDSSSADAINDLRSSDESERLAAKEKLFQSGQKVIPELMSFLEDLMRNQDRIYARGKEEETKEAESRLFQVKKINSEELEEIIRTSAFVINGRLKSDVCELLGRLHANVAIPLLIKMMEEEDTGRGAELEIMTPEMKALAAIGLDAVPQLIEAIETAESRASSILINDHRPSDFFIRVETTKYRARATMVLGEIGDAQALPVLQKLFDNEFLTPYLKESIQKIQNKQ